MAECLIALGSNLGDRSATLSAAVQALRDWPQISVISVSRWHSTAPIGGAVGQGEFLNGALRLSTTLAPHQLLDTLQIIQKNLGRQPHERWDARTIDLDLLLYGDLVLRDERMELPHPRMAFRRFVLAPAVEIAADMIHPTTGWRLDRLWSHLDDAPPYIAVTGVEPAVQQALAVRSQSRLVANQQAGDSLAGEPIETKTFLAPSPTDLTGCPGLSPAAAIQFLQHRASLLAEPTAWEPGSNTMVWLSDFWLAESLAWAEIDFGEDARFQTVLTAYAQLAHSLRCPRLIVLVEPGTADSDTRQLLAWDALQRRLGRPEVGPVLRVSSADLDWAVTEIVAAIQAMQP